MKPYTIDKTPPVVNITSLTNDSYVGHDVKITGATTDLYIKSVSFEIDGISMINTTEYLWDSTQVIGGEHEIRLNAEDKAGNVASTSIIVKVDFNGFANGSSRNPPMFISLSFRIKKYLGLYKNRGILQFPYQNA